MNEPVSICLTLHPAQYRALLKIAENRRVQVHHLIEGLVTTALAGGSGHRPRRAGRRVDVDELRRLHAEGLMDRPIAERLGVSVSAIQQHRSALGLVKNSQFGRPKRTASKEG